MSRKAWLILVGIGILATAVAVWTSLEGRSATGIRVTRGDLTHTVVASGRVAAAARTTLGTTMVGRVAEVRFREGERVRAGDVVVRLEDREAQAAVTQARAAVSEALARRDALRTVTGRVAEEDLRRAQAAVNLAEQRLRRIEALAASGAATDDDLDQARSLAEQARATLRASRSQVEAARAQGTESRAAEAALERARATLEVAEARLEETRIRAPADGTVLARAVEPGDVVSPGQALLTLAWEGAPYLVMEPDEKTLRLLRVGQEAIVSADAWPGQTFQARVAQVLPSVDPRKGTVEVRLAVPEPPEYLRPDLTVSIEVTVARKKGAMVVPLEAVRDIRAETARVWVVEEGRARVREVRLGIVGEDRVEVIEGVEEGDLVLLDPKADWTPGMRVRVQERVP